jgi:hypothetical protein
MTIVRGSLIAALHRAEAALPALLKQPDVWSTLDINYEPPRVLRLWTEFEEGFRVCLHQISPCERALFHPHPWPSAVKVLIGRYEMAVGFGAGDVAPPEAATITLYEGSYYEMVHPDGWHSVRPLQHDSFSVMVTGLPWNRWSPSPGGKLEGLADETKKSLIEAFKVFYTG